MLFSLDLLEFLLLLCQHSWVILGQFLLNFHSIANLLFFLLSLTFNFLLQIIFITFGRLMDLEFCRNTMLLLNHFLLTYLLLIISLIWRRSFSCNSLSTQLRLSILIGFGIDCLKCLLSSIDSGKFSCSFFMILPLTLFCSISIASVPPFLFNIQNSSFLHLLLILLRKNVPYIILFTDFPFLLLVKLLNHSLINELTFLNLFLSLEVFPEMLYLLFSHVIIKSLMQYGFLKLLHIDWLIPYIHH